MVDYNKLISSQVTKMVLTVCHGIDFEQIRSQSFVDIAIQRTLEKLVTDGAIRDFQFEVRKVLWKNSLLKKIHDLTPDAQPGDPYVVSHFDDDSFVMNPPQCVGTVVSVDKHEKNKGVILTNNKDTHTIMVDIYVNQRYQNEIRLSINI